VCGFEVDRFFFSQRKPGTRKRREEALILGNTTPSELDVPGWSSFRRSFSSGEIVQIGITPKQSRHYYTMTLSIPTAVMMMSYTDDITQ
jgi:hypothetical protein